MSLAASRISIPKAFRFKAFCMAFVCGLALPLAGCMIEDADKYVGKDPYTVFPQKFMVGQMDMPLPSGRPSVDWGMTLVWLGEHYMLTVDQNTTLSHDPQVWKIVAVRDIPLLKAGQMFALGGGGGPVRFHPGSVHGHPRRLDLRLPQRGHRGLSPREARLPQSALRPGRGPAAAGEHHDGAGRQEAARSGHRHSA